MLNFTATAPDATGESNFTVPTRPHYSVAARSFAILLLVVVGAALGVLADRLASRKPEAKENGVPSYGVAAKPGPWGDLYSVPFTISAPEDILPVRTMESTGTRWVLKGFTRADFEKLLRNADATSSERAALVDPSVLHESAGGIELTPPPSLVLSLSPKARVALYRALARFEENRSQLFFIHKDSLKERFDGSGVSDSTVRLFKQMCWESGDYFVFSGIGALLSQLPTYPEKMGFMKGITRQKTLMLKLHVKPDSDLEGLARYWGKGCWSTDIRTILESVAHATGGDWVNILMVLPPVPASELYFYPVVQDNPLNGPTVTRDCHWSSLNFFRDAPDPNFSRPDYVLEQLKTNYYPIFADPRYGDVLLLTKPDGSIIHSAVYIADEIVFTKNGATVLYPWMLSTVPDLLKQYTFQVSPGEKLNVAYYRNKSL